MIRPWLFLFRYRICAGIAVSLLMVLLLTGVTVILFDVGHCHCKPEASDFNLLGFSWLPILGAILGYVFGWSFTVSPSAGLPGANSYPRFLLTRPTSRTSVLIAPLLIFLVASVLIPPLAGAIILGAARIFHPAGIGRLLATLSFSPAVRALGPHPSLPAILLAINLPRLSIAGISVGLCAYTLMASQRWLVLSTNRNLQYLSIIPAVSIVAPSLLSLMNKHLVSAILLTPTRGAELTYIPSNLGIALHFLIAAAITFGCWRILRTAET